MITNPSLKLFVLLAILTLVITLVTCTLQEHSVKSVMDHCAFTCRDWDELILSDVPEVMKGQKLLTTVRGRGTETHFIHSLLSGLVIRIIPRNLES